MEDYLKEALEIVKAQASVRTMTEEEITSMVRKLAHGIQAIGCVCGKSFKILTKKHLGSHDLTPAEYREKFGYKKNFPLVCKSLQRERRKKMKDMKLWTKRGKKK